MKIATKTGDKGDTGLLFGQRVSKSDDRIDVLGSIDELSAAIGLIKPELSIELANNSFRLSPEDASKAYSFKELLSQIQLVLINLMGEIACEIGEREKYFNKFPCLSEGDLEKIDLETEYLQSLSALEQKDWVLYGLNRVGAQSHFASKVCRRSERILIQSNILYSRSYRPILIKYLNRLSDCLFLLARYFEEVFPKYT